MYAIIVGGGRVGTVIAESLIKKGNEVLVIERSVPRSDALRGRLGSCVTCGDGCETAVLAEAGADRADVFIAVTEGDEDNLVACQVAKHRFHVSRIVARVNNPKNVKIFKLLGIDATVNAVETLADGLLHEVPGVNLTHMAAFQKSGLRLVGVRLPDHAASIGKPLVEVPLPDGVSIAVIVRSDGTTQLPSDEVVLEPEDEVIAIALPELEEALVQALTR